MAARIPWVGATIQNSLAISRPPQLLDKVRDAESEWMNMDLAGKSRFLLKYHGVSIHTHPLFPHYPHSQLTQPPPAARDTGSFGIKGSKQDVAALHSLLSGIRLIPTMTAPTATLVHV